MKILEKIKSFFKTTPSMKIGDSMDHLGRCYERGLKKVPCHIGDEVTIHPVPGHSQATKSYPAKIVSEQVNGQDGRARGLIWVLTVDGIQGNSHRAWLNDYLFERLEFVSRNCKEKSSWKSPN